MFSPIPSIAFPHDDHNHMLNILLLSDIHGNFPALTAIEQFFADESFDLILNGGDSIVYAPFPSETLDWLRRHQAISILGNTDKKVLRLLQGKDLNKPRNIDKRIMYTSTVNQLDEVGHNDLLAMPIFLDLHLAVEDGDTVGRTVGLHHGSPAEPHEFLFADTPNTRFAELAAVSRSEIIVTGHSHTPYHKQVAGIHFINQLRHSPPLCRFGEGRAFSHRLRYRGGDQGAVRLPAPRDICQDVPGGQKTQLNICTFRRKSATVTRTGGNPSHGQKSKKAGKSRG